MAHGTAGLLQRVRGVVQGITMPVLLASLAMSLMVQSAPLSPDPATGHVVPDSYQRVTHYVTPLQANLRNGFLVAAVGVLLANSLLVQLEKRRGAR